MVAEDEACREEEGESGWKKQMGRGRRKTKTETKPWTKEEGETTGTLAGDTSVSRLHIAGKGKGKGG